MQEFVHHTIQKIDLLFAQFNKVQALYQAKSFEFEQQLDGFLLQFLTYFKEKGNNAKEAEILKTMNMIATVKRGFNPIKLEKIQTGKRDVFWGLAFNGMDSVLEILSEIHLKEKRKLEEAEEVLSNLVVSLYQNGVVNDAQIRELNSIPKINAFWDQLLLTQNGAMAAINKKLRLQLSPEDIYLILEKIFLRTL